MARRDSQYGREYNQTPFEAVAVVLDRDVVDVVGVADVATKFIPEDNWFVDDTVSIGDDVTVVNLKTENVPYLRTPAGWWKLDEAAPPALSSGTATNQLAVFNGTPTWGQPALYAGGGPSLQLNAANRIEAENPKRPFLATDTDLTVAIWAEHKSVSSPGFWFFSLDFEGQADCGIYMISYADVGGGLKIYGTSDGYVDDFYLEYLDGLLIDTPVAIVVTVDATEARLYVDGVLEDTDVRVGGTWTWGDPLTDVMTYFEMRANSGAVARLADFYVLEEVMSPADVAAFSTTGPSPSAPKVGITDTVVADLLLGGVSLPSIDDGFVGAPDVVLLGTLVDLASIDGNDTPVPGPSFATWDPADPPVDTLGLLSIDGSSIPYGVLDVVSLAPAPPASVGLTPTTPAPNPVGYPYASGSTTPPDYPGSDAYGTTTYSVTYDTGTGTLPAEGDTVTWDGGSGTVGSLDAGDATAGSVTIIYGTGTAPTGTLTSGTWGATTTATAPAVYAAGADTIPPDPAVTAVLLDRVGAVVGSLDGYVSCEWQDVLNDDGSGTIVLPYGHPMIASATPGCQVRCSYYGLEAFTFVVPDGAEIEAVADGEESAQTVTLSGPGRAALLERAMIYSPKGLAEAFNAQHRLFSFASPDYPYIDGFASDSYVHTEWHGRDNPDPITGVGTTRWMTNIEYTTVLRGEDDVVENIWWPAPVEWPIPQANWIWGTFDSEIVGRNYFWRQFTINAEVNAGIFVTGDNGWTLYLDGLPILGEDRYDHTWAEFKVLETKLPAGTYTLAAVVENWPWPPQYDNPGAFMCGVVPLTSSGETFPIAEVGLDIPPTPSEPTRSGKNAVDVANFLITDGTWKSLAYPLEEPGWSAGDIVRAMVAEAQARDALDSWLTAWNESDSGGDEWPLMAMFSAPIGSSVRDLLRSLVDQGVVDWDVLPGDMVLRMFNQSPAGVNVGTAFAVTGDIATQEIVAQTFSPQNEPVTRLLVKWSEGYFQVEAPAEAAVWGWQEGFVTIDAATQQEAERRANVLLEAIKEPRWSVVVTVDALEANRPYYAYRKGDRITVPDENGAPKAYRVMSISVVADDYGKAGVVLELDSQLLTRFRDEDNLIRLLGTAVVGNTKVRNALATTTAVAR
jgi:hypothetical protein